MSQANLIAIYVHFMCIGVFFIICTRSHIFKHNFKKTEYKLFGSTCMNLIDINKSNKKHFPYQKENLGIKKYEF